MKIVSFNCKGLARPDKNLTLHKLILTTPIDVIFLQETLGLADSITHLLDSMFPRSTFIGLDANGRSGGLSLGYNKHSINLSNFWGGPMHIGEDMFSFYLGIEEAGRELTKEITIGELEATLKWFKKDKSPGLDGWSIKFYLDFFETLGNDLLNVIEHSRTSGKIHESFTSTFFALIPKSDNPSTFDNYKPISLFNCIYTVMAKIIANRMQAILSKYISLEKISFLQDQQIHEGMGTA
eukprot:PITA_10037